MSNRWLDDLNQKKKEFESDSWAGSSSSDKLNQYSNSSPADTSTSNTNASNNRSMNPVVNLFKNALDYTNSPASQLKNPSFSSVQDYTKALTGDSQGASNNISTNTTNNLLSSISSLKPSTQKQDYVSNYATNIKPLDFTPSTQKQYEVANYTPYVNPIKNSPTDNVNTGIFTPITKAEDAFQNSNLYQSIANSPIGKFLSRASEVGGQAATFNQSNPTNKPNTDLGNKIANTAADFLGTGIGLAVNPGGIGSIGGALDKIVGQPVEKLISNPIRNVVAKKTGISSIDELSTPVYNALQYGLQANKSGLEWAGFTGAQDAINTGNPNIPQPSYSDVANGMLKSYLGGAIFGVATKGIKEEAMPRVANILEKKALNNQGYQEVYPDLGVWYKNNTSQQFVPDDATGTTGHYETVKSNPTVYYEQTPYRGQMIPKWTVKLADGLKNSKSADEAYNTMNGFYGNVNKNIDNLINAENPVNVTQEKPIVATKDNVTEPMQSQNNVSNAIAPIENKTVVEPLKSTVAPQQNEIKVLDDYSKMSDDEINGNMTFLTDTANELLKSNNNVVTPEIQDKLNKIGLITNGLIAEKNNRVNTNVVPAEQPINNTPNNIDAPTTNVEPATANLGNGNAIAQPIVENSNVGQTVSMNNADTAIIQNRLNKTQNELESIDKVIASNKEKGVKTPQLLLKRYNDLSTSANEVVAPKVSEEVAFNDEQNRLNAGTVNKINSDGTIEIKTPEGNLYNVKKNNGNYETVLSKPTSKEQIPIDERINNDKIKDKNVKAYQYLHPELKNHIQSEANIMLGELQNTTKGEKFFTPNGQGDVKITGNKRITSSEIASLRNEGHSYADIEKGLNNIIKDHGSENTILAKKIEALIDMRLSTGYQDFASGIDIPANKDYIAMKNSIEGQGKIKTQPQAINKTSYEVKAEIKPQEVVAKSVINEATAKRAKENMSHDNYIEGSATEQYNNAVKQVADLIEKSKAKVSDEGKLKLDRILYKYKKGLADWTNRRNANGASHVSVMVSGAGNYNMKAHEKYLSREGKLWEEYNEKYKDEVINNKISSIVDGDKIIKSDDPQALTKLREKLAKAEEEHQGYKNHNIKAKKEGKELLPGYVLQNSNARMKSIKERIARLEKLESEKSNSTTGIEVIKEYNGASIVKNYDADRVQILFDEKPSSKVVSELKGHGWRYSPTNNAWQRKITSDAEYSSKMIMDKLFSNKDTASNTEVAQTKSETPSQFKGRDTSLGIVAPGTIISNNTPKTGKATFTDAEVESRYQGSHGIKKASTISKVKNWLIEFKNMTRTFRFVDEKNPVFAEFKKEMTLYSKFYNIAATNTEAILKDITDNLGKNTYDVFNRYVVLKDLQEEAKLGHMLPFGLNAQKIDEELNNLSQYMSASVTQAVDKRTNYWTEIKDNYIKAMESVGFNVGNRFNRENYFRHQVLDKMIENQSANKGASGKDKTPTGRGFLKERKGSELDINTDYLQAEYEVMAQMIRDTKLAEMHKRIIDKYDISKKLKAEAKQQTEENLKDLKPQLKKLNQELKSLIKNNASVDEVNIKKQDIKALKAEMKSKVVKWQSLVPDDSDIMQFREGNTYYTATTLSERMANEIFANAPNMVGVDKEQLKSALAMGKRYPEYVFDKNIIETLKQVSTLKKMNPVSNITKKTLTLWKRWVLGINPHTFLRYNIRNMTGDMDKATSADPRIMKNMKRATSEINASFKYGRFSPELLKYFNRSGFGNTTYAQELGDINSMATFEGLYNEKKGIKIKNPLVKWIKFTENVNNERESILRYSAFLRAKEMLKKGKPVYWASKPAEIDGLKSIDDKAYKLANDLLGAYDEVSELGKTLRDYWIPFYSWLEVNFKGYTQLLKNNSNMKIIEKQLNYKGKNINTATKTEQLLLNNSMFITKAVALTAILAVWNMMFFPNEEDELSNDIKNTVHIIFGRDSNGNIRYFNRLGSLSDFLEWFGLSGISTDIKDLNLGRKTGIEQFTDMLKRPVNKFVSGVNPFIKTAGELISGRKLYPDIFNPATIRDKRTYIGQTIGLPTEVNAVLGIPQNSNAGDMALNTVSYKSDPMANAYYSILDKKQQFEKNVLGQYPTQAFSSSPKSLALYYYKLSLKNNDQDMANKYLQEYHDKGGTDKGIEQSLKMMSPIYGLVEDDKKNRHEYNQFMNYLTTDEKAELNKAMQYYNNLIYSSPVQPKTSKKK